MPQEPSTPARSTVVIGATGNLGRHICTAFSTAGHDVTGVARSTAEGIDAARLLPIDAAADPAELRDALAAHDPDVVVNVSGGWGTTEREMHDAHVLLVERLVAAAAGLDRRPRLVQVGTIHEYGPVPQGTSVDEQHDGVPLADYGRTKLAGSSLVLEATADGLIDGVVLRVVNVCGPGTQAASFLGSLAARLCGTEPGAPIELTIAEAERDYVDVRDVADAVLRAGTGGAEVVGKVVNIGCGRAVSMRTLVTTLVEAAGLDPRDIVEVPAEISSKGGDWTQADITRARALLGWVPTTPLRASMADMCAEIRSTSGA
ncbi:nucleoside-diphosphate-sugar epimerase [Nocardiopsis mwathae]|uniref:Nucleoside-diphosphate-sugar epimerase n=1 Tax=Nocardiopsis mwathae TaxID=1472723 RepID=A0A7W9YL80_9ACTN|nr:NAD(P)-dependent oxidoreductase [Nocardiopsis mwathae]MBB6174218.1 nucleoside-diphosphate-sugar epimerase [Nocardiopsis mwathae]